MTLPVLDIGTAVVTLQFLFVIKIVGGLFAGLWAFSDARRRGMTDPLLWFIIVFLAMIIGLLIYLMLRPTVGAEQYPAEAS